MRRAPASHMALDAVIPALKGVSHEKIGAAGGKVGRSYCNTTRLCQICPTITLCRQTLPPMPLQLDRDTQGKPVHATLLTEGNQSHLFLEVQCYSMGIDIVMLQKRHSKFC